MAYCTNCGKPSTGKICGSCGVKLNTTHHFCAACGTQLNEAAAICVNCQEPVQVKNGFLSKIIPIICIALFVTLGIMGITEGSIVSAIFFFLAAVVLLPFVKNLIREKTYQNLGMRKLLNVLRLILPIVLVVTGVALLPKTEVENKVYKDYATNAALVVFHEDVKLKNEASFVLNDSKVTYSNDPYNGNKNLCEVTVVLDYSAQNGFGGTNRENYTVKMIFNYENGGYYRMNNTYISNGQ